MLRTTWQPEPELQQPFPRAVKLRRGAVFETILLTFGLLLIGGFSAGALAWEAWLTHCDAKAREEGVEIDVEVTAKRKQTGRHGKISGYIVEYQFRGATGGLHEASRKISRKDFERIQVGDFLPGRAVPGRLEFHTLSGIPRAGLTRLQIGAMCVFLAATPILVTMFRRQRRRDERLIRYGQVAAATVVRKLRVKGKRHRYEATFKVAGIEHKVSGIASTGAAETGGAVTVLHDPLDPGKAVIYAAASYQAAPAN